MKEEFIDILKIFNLLVKKKTFIIKNAILISFIGILYSLSLPNIYKSSSTFYPHYQNIEQTSRLSEIAGLAGLNLNNQQSMDVPPNLYPKLISSSTFKNELLNEKLTISNETISYRDYLLKHNKSFISTLIFEPDYDSKKEKGNIEGILSLSNSDHILHKQLEKLLEIEVNEKDGFINLIVYDRDKYVSSKIAKKVQELLQKSIINFKIKNVKTLYDFTNNQLIYAQNKLYKLQDSIANFKDANLNIKSDFFLNQLKRLETELNTYKNIYNELAINKERTAIDVQKNTPIFTIINPVVLPNEKFSPKRAFIVLSFLFIGVLFSVFYLIVKENLL